MIEIMHKCPEHFLDEETRCDFKISKNLKEIWAVELDLLEELKRVCNQYSIPFYADSGTLLGAARHSGFIPWDDDVDVIMLRKDYIELCKHASDFKFPYFFQTEETDPMSFRGHAQLRNSLTTGILRSEIGCKLPFNQGIFLDIFVLDFVPDDEKECDNFLKKLNHLSFKVRALYSIAFCKKAGRLKYAMVMVLHVLTKPFCKKWLHHVYYKRERLMQSCAESNHVMKLFFYPTRITPIMDFEWYSNYDEFPFEYTSIRVPIGYDEVLKKFYGEWHEMRKSGSLHGEVVYNTDISYKEYSVKKNELVK